MLFALRTCLKKANNKVRKKKDSTKGVLNYRVRYALFTWIISAYTIRIVIQTSERERKKRKKNYNFFFPSSKLLKHSRQHGFHFIILNGFLKKQKMSNQGP